MAAAFAVWSRQDCLPLEITVVRLLAEGFSSKEISPRINRSRSSVEATIQTLFVKFGARSRTHLVAIALRRGLIE
jgi:two-component system NarL family response regulator